MDRVSFVAPVSASDLRVVLTSTSADDHDVFAVCYRTQFGETRIINWLTKIEANARGAALRKRGYRVVVGPMDIA